MASEIYRARGEFAKAAQTLQKISPDSPRYPDALFRAGVAYWRSSSAELRKPEAARDRARAEADLQKAQALLRDSLKLQEKDLKPEAAPTHLLLDTRLSLAELLVDNDRGADALALLEPLEKLAAQTPRPKAFDGLVLRLHLATLRDYVAGNQLDKARGIMTLIEKEGSNDSVQITRVYVQLGQQLERQLGQLEAAGKTQAAEQTRASFVAFLNQLAARKEQTIASMRYIAEAFFGLGMYDQAEQKFQAMLERAGSDPAFATPAARTGLIPIQVKLAVAQQKQGHFDAALGTIDGVLQDHAQMVEPMMVKGQILQEAGAFAKAASWWIQPVIATLGRQPKKPIEYYEAMLHLAECQTKLGNADAALKTLRRTMSLHPDLGGPAMKVRYEDLLKTLDSNTQASR